MTKKVTVTVGGSRGSLDQGYEYYPLDGTRQSSFIQINDKNLIANEADVKKAVKLKDYTRMIAWGEPADALAAQLDQDLKPVITHVDRVRNRTIKLSSGVRERQSEIVVGAIDGMEENTSPDMTDEAM